MIFSIVVSGSAFTIFLVSLCEFLFLIPSIILARKKQIQFRQYVKNTLYKPEQVKNIALQILASASIPFGMLFLAPLLIQLQGAFISAAFGESILQQARDSLNKFIIVQPSIIDTILYGITSFCIIALNEELFFRAFLQKVLGRGKGVKIVCSSLLFAAYHLLTTFNVYSILYMGLYYFTWGIVLSVEYHACREQLVYPIATHGLFNLLLLLI